MNVLMCMYVCGHYNYVIALLLVMFEMNLFVICKLRSMFNTSFRVVVSVDGFNICIKCVCIKCIKYTIVLSLITITSLLLLLFICLLR